MVCSSRRNCSLCLLERSSTFFASHGTCTCPLTLKLLKCCFSFSSHFFRNDNDGEDFICHFWGLLLFYQSTLLVVVLHWSCCLILNKLLCKQECTRKTKKNGQEKPRSIPAHPVQDPSLTWPSQFIKEKPSHYMWYKIYGIHRKGV